MCICVCGMDVQKARKLSLIQLEQEGAGKFRIMIQLEDEIIRVALWMFRCHDEGRRKSFVCGGVCMHACGACVCVHVCSTSECEHVCMCVCVYAQSFLFNHCMII